MVVPLRHWGRLRADLLHDRLAAANRLRSARTGHCSHRNRSVVSHASRSRIRRRVRSYASRVRCSSRSLRSSISSTRASVSWIRSVTSPDMQPRAILRSYTTPERVTCEQPVKRHARSPHIPQGIRRRSVHRLSTGEICPQVRFTIEASCRLPERCVRPAQMSAHVAPMAAELQTDEPTPEKVSIDSMVLDNVAKRLTVLVGAAVVPLETLCTAYVRAAVEACGGNKSHAAKALGIDRRSIYRWLAKVA